MGKDRELHFEEAVFEPGDNQEFGYVEMLTSRKAFLFIAIVGLLFTGVALVRVGALNVMSGKFYRARAAQNVSREITLPARRAVIVDRFGEVVVKNKTSFSVFVDASALFGDTDEFQSILTEVADILKLESAELIEGVREVDFEKNNWVPVARDISSSEAIAIRGLGEGSIQIIDDYIREYINGPIFSHIMGYTGIGKGNSIVGKVGLELYYDEAIRGSDGKYLIYHNARGEIFDEKIAFDPESSEVLATTLDADLQRYFYTRLRSTLISLERTSGVGIALNPKNGEILALVSFPSFDNNAFVDKAKNEERGRILTNSSQPLFNRAISGVYSPGSAIKPLVALGALREDIITPQTRIFSAGSLVIPNPYVPEAPSIFLDWKPHGWVNVENALARSSNIYFYLIGGGVPQEVSRNGLIEGQFSSGLGIKKLNTYWEQFGFSELTGIDLPGESDGFLPNAQEKEERTGSPWRIGDTFNVSIGQGDLLVTPLQLVNFIASIGNGGTVYRPHLLVSDEPEILSDYTNWNEELAVVQKGLRTAVTSSEGSSSMMNGLPIAVAGKTGTPQVANKTKVNAFFSGYAPADDPEIAILVLIENAKTGSLNALPVARDVFNWYYHNRMVISEKEDSALSLN